MRTKHRGVAVVLAMGVVALAAIAAAAMLASQGTWSRRAELTSEHVQAQALAQAGVDWARAVLSDDRRSSGVDHLGEPWALRLPPVPVDNGELAGQIEDQQGAFNLNNLLKNGAVSPPYVQQFRRLLRILDLPDALADAYLAAGRPLIDAAELATVPGFDEAVRARLRPFITALPRFTAVNVNTASPEVLATVIEGLDLDAARELVAQRGRAYFRDRAEFLAQLPPGAVAGANDVATGSDFFQASVRVTIGGAQARGTALLARQGAGWPAVVWRKYP
ncbi:MAG: general secretion pathway protein GspK [Betaproteobacteria bacterium]|nr:MAG: general secretion pathway protein GspK [Betaproteobacteria bacterium]